MNVLSDVNPNNSTTVPSSRPRPLWSRSRVEPKPCVCALMWGCVMLGCVPWDSGRRLYNATFHFPLHSAEGSPPPAGQWARGPRPAGGGRRGKWLAAHPEIDSPPSVHLPSHCERQRRHTLSTTKTDKLMYIVGVVYVHWRLPNGEKVNPKIMTVSFEGKNYNLLSWLFFLSSNFHLLPCERLWLPCCPSPSCSTNSWITGSGWEQSRSK